MRPDELERRPRERLDALGPATRAELLHVLMLPDFERADGIGEFYRKPRTRRSPSSGLSPHPRKDGNRNSRVDQPTLRGFLKPAGVIP
jgi:hypothetical protein